jgi:nitric-oxide synthase
MLLELSSDFPYAPGDHVGVYACNRKELVDGILSRLQTTTDPDQPVELQMQKENHTSNGKLQVVSKDVIGEVSVFHSSECQHGQ